MSSRYVRFSWVTADPNSDGEALQPQAGLDYISPAWFALDGDGELHPRSIGDPGRQRAWQAAVQQAGCAVLPAVTYWDRSRDAVLALLENPKPRLRAVAALERACLDRNWDGITVALRGPYPDGRDGLSALIEELSWTLHRRERRLAIVVTPQVRDPELDETPSVPGADPAAWWQAWTDACDYRAVGVYVDLFILATVDFPHRPLKVTGGYGDGSAARLQFGPGAVTPIGWLQSAVEHALLHVPPRRLLITLPFYGRQWLTGANGEPASTPSSTVIPFAEAAATVPEAAWQQVAADAASGGQVYRRTGADGSQIALYIDDEASLRAKGNLVASYDLGGIAVWRLGFGTPAAWAAVNDALRPGGKGKGS